MKLTDIDYDSQIKLTDFENFFEVHDLNGVYRYNLNNTLFLNIADDQLLTYELKSYAHWPLISYQLYKTTRLAWLLMKINKVSCADTMKRYSPGEKIKYISSDNVKIVLRALD